MMSNEKINEGYREPSFAQRLLQTHQTYGWKPDPMLSDDENYMDLILILTRSSKLKQGGMACILVKPKEEGQEEAVMIGDREEENLSLLLDRIISVATNRELYKENESDIHAEIVAIGQVAANNNVSTSGATAYITMPPCKRCFAALLVAGVCRIVTRHSYSNIIQSVAEKHNIEIVSVAENKERIRQIVQLYHEQCATTEREEEEGGGGN